MTTQDGKYDVENIRMVKEKPSGEKNIEEKKQVIRRKRQKTR